MPAATPAQDQRKATLCIAIAAKGGTDLGDCLSALAGAADARVSLCVVHDREIDWNGLLAPHPGFTCAAQDSPLATCLVHSQRVAASTSILKYWGAALAQAKTDYVAVLDASCPPNSRWLQQALEQIDQGREIFYGPVKCRWEATDRRAIGYIIEYSQFMSPVLQRDEFPGNNLVLQRELLPTSPSLAQDGFFKTFLLWKLAQERALTPHYCDELGVCYQKPFALGAYIRRRRDHGRCFGARRFEQPNQPPRWLCILFTPLLGLLRCGRIWRGLRHQPGLRRGFWRHLAAILAAEHAWALGEFLGYCFGDNGTCQRLD